MIKIIIVIANNNKIIIQVDLNNINKIITIIYIFIQRAIMLITKIVKIVTQNIYNNSFSLETKTKMIIIYNKVKIIIVIKN